MNNRRVRNARITVDGVACQLLWEEGARVHIDDGKQKLQVHFSCVTFRAECGQPLRAESDEHDDGVVAVKFCRRAGGYHVGEMIELGPMASNAQDVSQEICNGKLALR